MQPVDDLIIKYLNDTLTSQESLKLNKWVKKSPENETYFKDFIKQEFLLLHSIIDHPENVQFDNSRNLPKPKKKRSIKYAIAAVFLAAITVASVVEFLQPKELQDQIPVFKVNQVVLQLEDGSTTTVDKIESLEKIQTDSIEVNQQKEQIAYRSNQRLTSKQLVYHKIIVPTGRKYKIKLSDGTLVHLNAASTLRYPKQFSTKGPRNVYLQGEGYFEVSHDSIHPFIVHTEPLTVKVLGTKFNHSSYPEDSIVKITLQKGKVAVWKTKDSIDTYILKPMEAIVYNTNQKSLSKKTTDLRLDLAWMDNLLVFKAEPFSQILKRIERCYGVQITNHFNELNQIRFNGEFDLNQESIIEVLNTFQLSTPFTYHITDNEIIITKKQ